MITLEILLALAITKPSDQYLNLLSFAKQGVSKSDLKKIKHLKEHFNLSNLWMIKPLLDHSGDARLKKFYDSLPNELKDPFIEGLNTIIQPTYSKDSCITN